MGARWGNIAAELGHAPAKSDVRRTAGARGHRQGHAFEDALDGLHKLYGAADRAYVAKVPAPYRVTSSPKGGHFHGVFEGEGPPDYFALVGGRALVFDAKQTSGDRWRFEALAEHQARHMDAATRHGAFAFVLLWMGGSVWVVPWGALGPLWWAWARRSERSTAGTASLSPAQLREMAQPCQGCDWLPVVLRLLGAP